MADASNVEVVLHESDGALINLEELMNVDRPATDTNDEPQKKNRRGSSIRHRKREDVVKLAHEVNNALQSKEHRRKTASVVCKSICEQMNISKTSYYRILKESKAAGGGKLATPGKKRPRKLSKVLTFDSFQVGSLRRKINDLYAEKVNPSVKMLLQYAKEELNYDGAFTTLLTIINKELGFKFKKVNGKNFLMERHNVRLQRYNFLKSFRKLKSEGRNFIFLDETLLWENHGVQKFGQTQECAGKKVKFRKGKQLVVLHAGGKDGFVKDCLLTFNSSPGRVGVPRDMNATIFTEWFKEKLLPNIPAYSVIVMDNAAYHSMRSNKPPTSAATKSDIVDWLHSKGIYEANSSMMKVELYQMVKENKPRLAKYVIDELAAKAGHMVLRLPPYHREYNPIELVWAKVKEDVRKQNKTFKINDVEALIKELCSNLGAEFWQNCINHTDNICEEAYAAEGVTELCVEELIGNLGELDDECDSDSDDSFSD